MSNFAESHHRGFGLGCVEEFWEGVLNQAALFSFGVRGGVATGQYPGSNHISDTHLDSVNQ
jgi:hypothetical protein